MGSRASTVSETHAVCAVTSSRLMGSPLELVQAYADAWGLGSSHDLDVNHIDAVLGGAGLQGVDDVLLELALDHATPLLHEKGARANPHSLHVTTSFAAAL